MLLLCLCVYVNGVQVLTNIYIAKIVIIIQEKTRQKENRKRTDNHFILQDFWPRKVDVCLLCFKKLKTIPSDLIWTS